MGLEVMKLFNELPIAFTTEVSNRMAESVSTATEAEAEGSGPSPEEV
jgi:hypothetical protein